MWGKIYDAVIKSLISVERTLFDSTKEVKNCTNYGRSNFFELLGYDILLDSNMHPWILEVNLAPSLSADSPMDYHLKSNLIVDMFNVVGIRKLPSIRKNAMKHVSRVASSRNTSN